MPLPQRLTPRRRLTVHKILVIVSGYIAYGLPVGYYYGFGALFPVIMDTFDASRAETSIIQSVFAGIIAGGGILYGVIISRFGPMKATIFGSLATSLSLIVSFWATNLPFLVATNVVTGIGCGIGFVSSTVGVRQHFSGKAAVIALAIISSAPGTVGVGFTYVLRFLSEVYGLRGTLLVIGGVQLNVAAMGLLLKNPVKGSRFINNPTIDDNTTNSDHDTKLETNNGETIEFHTNCTDEISTNPPTNELQRNLSDMCMDKTRICIEDITETDRYVTVKVLVEHGNEMLPFRRRHSDETIKNQNDNEINIQSNGHINEAYETDLDISDEPLEDSKSVEQSDMVC